jgi:hypothetical protein
MAGPLSTAVLAPASDEPYHDCPIPLQPRGYRRVSNRLATVLVAAVFCLGAVPFIARSESTVAAAQVQDTEPVAGELVQPFDTVVEQPVTPAHSAIDLAAAEAAGVSVNVLTMALNAVQCAVTSGDIDAPPTLTVIDYSLPSTQPRLWVFDMRSGMMLYSELVAHGKGTGENLAAHFSDDMNSHQSSLGLFVTRDTYVGSNGYSLRLDGLEPGFNSRARERAIVMHGAGYVNAEFAAKQGRLGRSWGCPALREAVAHDVIDTVRGGGVIFSYYPDQKWLTTSRFLNCGRDAQQVVATR